MGTLALGEGDMPTTIAQLLALLQKNKIEVKTDDAPVFSPKHTGRVKLQTKRRKATTDKPSLPGEWEEHRQLPNQASMQSKQHNINEGRDDGDEKQNEDVSASYTSKVDDDPGTPARDGRKMEAGIKYPEQASVQTHEQTEDILMKEDMFEFQAVEQAESSNTNEEGSAPLGHEQQAERGRSPTKRIITRGKPGRNVGKLKGDWTVPKEPQKAASTSPKRRAPEAWENDPRPLKGGRKTASAWCTIPCCWGFCRKYRRPKGWEGFLETLSSLSKITTRADKQPRKARSSSPTKHKRRSYRRADLAVTQRYMHQFLSTTSGQQIDKFGKPDLGESGGHTQNSETTVQEQHDSIMEDTSCGGGEYEFVRVKPPIDFGESLDTWLWILGGTLIDVAANGHCGWLACYASLYNVQAGLLQPSPEVIAAANLLKKDILNGMLATLKDEMTLHPEELNVELEASGIRSLGNAEQSRRFCALGNHYAAQRNKSVNSVVPTHFWVRPAHIKGMAIHARETIYVLDVGADNREQGCRPMRTRA